MFVWTERDKLAHNHAHKPLKDIVESSFSVGGLSKWASPLIQQVAFVSWASVLDYQQIIVPPGTPRWSR
jgi:hypothetical protein